MENILSVDVEEWFHPEYVRRKTSKGESRISQGVQKVLQLLDEFKISATFFVVGEVAERSPEVLRRIYDSGHEVAFHGYIHEPLWDSNTDIFRYEVRKFNSIISSVTREKCLGFRAPSYSLDNRTLWALDILDESGYSYDSSVCPVRTPLYGVSSAPLTPYRPSRRNIAKHDEEQRLVEFPALVYPFMGFRVPAAGGFYLRFFPLIVMKRAIRKMLKQGAPAVFSFHTWEVDRDIPRLKLGPVKSFVTYYNLNATEKKLRSLLSSFRFTSFRDHMEKYSLV